MLLVWFRLVKLGYGTMKEVREFDARVVIQALHYETFLSNYESASMEIATNENR